MPVFGLLSTYPPTQCGLATFTSSLRDGLTSAGQETRVVRVMEHPVDGSSGSPREVVEHLVHGDAASARAAVAALDACDVAVVQHEYGIYGGRDGQDVLDVLTALEVPTLAVLHTVLARPTPRQRQILERVADAVDAVVVMSRKAADRLLAGYAVDAAKIAVIPHGANALRRPEGAAPYADRRSPGKPATILTWGLIGPGKGIEWGVDALAEVRAAGVNARYLVAGETHPKVLEHQGERYRDTLRAEAEAAGIGDAVVFDDAYRDAESLERLAAQADVVLLPYESSEQVTSGVLIEAVAARRPVVATAFPHAEELLASGAGLVVPHRDATATAEALRRVLTEPGLAASMMNHAGRIAPELDWSAVASSYVRLAALVRNNRSELVV
jgi:glycosyltransferase involved in cell wall biosynthesis